MTRAAPTTNRKPHRLEKLKHDVIARARALGFCEIRITSPGAIPHAAPRLGEFIDKNRHGDMHWMKDTRFRRETPKRLMPTAKTVIMLAMNYTPETDPRQELDDKTRAVVSAYARRRDYHEVMKGRLKQVAGFLASRAVCDVKVFVDTAPLMEKPLAEAAGLGWQGKHTNLVSREYGSWLFLGAILTDASLPLDEPETDHCGTCRRCLDVCPTDAFPAPYQLDARKCIAYLTNEHKGHIDNVFRKPIGNRIFGCDDCLAVCPWNKYASQSTDAKFKTREKIGNPVLRDLLTLDDAAFRQLFTGTPVKRLGRARFLRNALIAAGNSNDTTLLPLVEALLDEPSPLVRAMAVWALGELSNGTDIARLKATHESKEADTDVRNEWNRLPT